MNFMLRMVRQFMLLFKQTVLETPAMPAEDRKKLRLNLIREELEELQEAFRADNITETADALADLLYVVIGCAHECGLGTKMHDIFFEVHRSNMSKACDSYEDAELTIRSYNAASKVECYIEAHGDAWLVFRKSDNKLLKSIRYSPANIKAILEA